jgi:hypothetical protein
LRTAALKLAFRVHSRVASEAHIGLRRSDPVRQQAAVGELHRVVEPGLDGAGPELLV